MSDPKPPAILLDRHDFAALIRRQTIETPAALVMLSDIGFDAMLAEIGRAMHEEQKGKRCSPNQS